MDSFATVAVFQDLTSACFFRSLLEENGLDAFVPDEYVCATRSPNMLVAVGLVRVQVPADQAEEARDVLKNAGEEMTGLSITPDQLGQTPALPPVASEWKMTWLLYGVISVPGLIFALPVFGLPFLWHNAVFASRHGASFWESLPHALLAIFFLLLGLSILYYVVRSLLRPRASESLPGPAAVTEEDFVPGPESEPGEVLSFWSNRFDAVRFVLGWLLFAFLIALVHHGILFLHSLHV